MRSRQVALAAVVAVLGVAAPAQADQADPMPRKAALDEYSGLFHKCRILTSCTAGRNIRRRGIRVKWISVSGHRRHWATRPAHADDIAARIRGLRRRTYRSAWVIPAPIVMCESGGINKPPNGASASGFYQIIHSTWVRMGGLRFAPAAYLASREEQDIIARRIWNAGGASQWDCARIVGIG